MEGPDFGILYVVATPIGNLQDITFRALNILKEVDLILAEDTRVTSKITRHFDIQNSIMSYHSHSSENKKFEILKKLLDGKIIGLVTDAGTPGISDPGNELIDFVLDKEPRIEVIPIPGSSASTAALSICGFNVNKYFFAGFLPKKRLSKLFTQVRNSELPLVFFESPNRILKTLDKLIEEFGGERRVFVGRELTKMYEETFRGSLVDVKEQMLNSNPRGEMVVVLEGK